MRMPYHGHARSLKTVTDICLLDDDADVDMAAVISDLVANERDSVVIVVRRRCTIILFTHSSLLHVFCTEIAFFYFYAL